MSAIMIPVNSLQASRAQILKKAAEYISAMRRKSSIQSNDIDDLKRQNANIETQSKSHQLIVQRPWSLLHVIICPTFAVRQLERARDSYNGAEGGDVGNNVAGPEEDSSEEANGGAYARRTKKMKTTNGGY